MIESALTDFPEPDSPTMPSVDPASSEYESPFTAVTRPSSVRKVVWRFLTSSSGTGAALDPGQRENGPNHHKRHRHKAGDPLELLLSAGTSVGRLHGTADGAGQAFLLGRLHCQQGDQEYRRQDKDARERVREPTEMLLKDREVLRSGGLRLELRLLRGQRRRRRAGGGFDRGRGGLGGGGGNQG